MNEQDLLKRIEKLERQVEAMRSARDVNMTENFVDQIFLNKEDDSSSLGNQDHLFIFRWKGRVYKIPAYNL